MRYKLSIETLSPLHIGTGTELLKDFDYVSVDDVTYIINQDAVYSAEFDQRGGAARLNVPAGRLVSADQWREGSPLVRYTLRGSTSIERAREQIKDVHGHCYIPGSSLKGALRTGLLSYASIRGILGNTDVNYRQNNRGGYVKESAAQNFEREFFRPRRDDPNHDFLRVLHVFDSASLPLQPSPLALRHARVFTGGEPGSPIVVEAIQKGAVFEAEITIDELVLQYAEKLGWNDCRLWLVNLMPILQTISRQRIQQEFKTAQEKGFGTAVKFYQQLEQLARQLTGSESAILQMGWGTGWTGMTIGPWLPKSTQDKARKEFELGRPPTQRGGWEPNLNFPFPKSRRLLAKNEQPGVPFGWVAVTLEPVGKVSSEWQSIQQQGRSLFKMDNAPVPTPVSLLQSAPAPIESTRSATPTPQTEKLVPTKKPIISKFITTPRQGDQFEGVIFGESSGEILLEIPGLDPDTDAYAVLFRHENPFIGKAKDGQILVCEVRSVQKEKDYWRVECKLG